MLYIRMVLLSSLAAILFTSCKPKAGSAPLTKEQQELAKDGTYWSINQYIKDQWNTYLGQPYSIVKVTTQNGKTDSVLKNALNLQWGDILGRFFASDISAPKYLGHYNFNLFLDETSDTRNFYYEAKDDTLFTRKLQITAMQQNNRISSIYIETQRKTGTKDIVQKLYYSPLKVIQIQEFDALATGDKHELRIAYYFM